MSGGLVNHQCCADDHQCISIWRSCEKYWVVNNICQRLSLNPTRQNGHQYVAVWYSIWCSTTLWLNWKTVWGSFCMFSQINHYDKGTCSSLQRLVPLNNSLWSHCVNDRQQICPHSPTPTNLFSTNFRTPQIVRLYFPKISAVVAIIFWTKKLKSQYFDLETHIFFSEVF